MARKGSTKVRTGCLTCKVRKIKCDEGKPHCKRCTSTGRKCDGYAQASTSTALSWHRPRHLFSNVDDASERRCLEFFCEVAAPVLSGPLDPYFWTHLVFQFSHMEPAVRHSVVAISSLYEHAHRHLDTTSSPLLDNSLALQHYNAAIRYLKTMNNEPLVLLVCLLFTCIEFIRGDHAAATEHSQHGISMLKRVEETLPWVKQYLSPLFRRLGVLPFFFAIPSRSRPNLICVDDAIPPFSALTDAQFYLDGLISRTIRLVRNGDVYRLGHLRHEPVSPDLVVEQGHTRTLLDDWHSSFVQLTSRFTGLEVDSISRDNMSLRYLICRVWVETAFDFYQTAYDEHLDHFRSMFDLATSIESLGYCSKPIKFTFEMGFIPLLYFVTTKCRCLETRLRALSMMKRLGAARENLWEMVTMFASAKRIIEVEHGAFITDEEKLSGEPSCPGLPPDEMRVRDSSTEPQPIVRLVDGIETVGRKGGFFMRAADDSIYVRKEFLPQPSWTMENPQAGRRILPSVSPL